MKQSTLTITVSAIFFCAILTAVSTQAAPKSSPKSSFEWVTVVNNNDEMPGTPGRRTFNSYNQPSVNLDGLVVFRARSRGGSGYGQPTHGIYTRDMSDDNSDIVRILDRTTRVPYPNNLETKFVETPSFPRIDMNSETIATRGNHQPVWSYLPYDGNEETRGGTTGIYSNPFGPLITAASKLGDAPNLFFFEVPEEALATRFEVFPGAPSVTNGDTIVFKGNYTIEGISKTGIYYRTLRDGPAGGGTSARLIANNTKTVIPGTEQTFGSTSPPSAANGHVVFAGFDNEENPTLGGLYLAPLQDRPPLTTLVSIGERVPGELTHETFNGLGEGVAFDGRLVGFWGSWGEDTRTVRLYCAQEGNKNRIAYCNQELFCAETGERLGDQNSVCNDETDPNFGISCYQDKEVPVNQGFFVHDSKTGRTRIVAKTGKQFDEFLYWNYSGMTPCVGSGHSMEDAADDGEPARWRSSTFISVSSGGGATFKAAFKGRTGKLKNGVYMHPVDAIYFRKSPGNAPIVTVLDTTMDGQSLDPDAPVNSTITELGLEREGLRGDWLAVNASMTVEGGSEEDSMAGIYLTELP